MSRICRTQPEVEKFLIREFLRDLGYSISRRSWQDKPDAVVTLTKGESRTRVAIEHTEYFNDTEAGRRSALTPYDQFWKIVQDSLVRRISHRGKLTGISARVSLKANLSKPKNRTELARELAKELVDFVEAHSVRQSQHRRFCSRDFDHRFRTMQLLLTYLLLSRGTHDAVPASRSAWICSNVGTGLIGIALPYLKTAIENKNQKAGNYDWQDADEKWLLIAASGTTVSNHAGPPMQDAKWTDAELMELCRNSPFHRIIFWERIRCWYKWLKPDRPIVQYRNPYIE